MIPVQADGVEKSFGLLQALRAVSFRLTEGQLTLLAGSNGAGKTTLLRLLAGVCRPTKGRVLVAGVDPAHTPKVRAQIGFLSHQSMLYEDLTADENLNFAARLYGLEDREDRIRERLEQLGLSGWRTRRVRTFSRGMKQRLSLARATLHDPNVILLDEPFTGLDQRACDALAEQVQEFSQRGCTGVMVTHRMEAAAQLVDHVLILKKGGICHDAKCQDQSAATLRALYRECLDERL